MTSKQGRKSKESWVSLKPQANRATRLTVDYIDSVREVKAEIQNNQAFFAIKKHIEDDWLWKNAHTCPPITPGSNVHVYKPDVNPPLVGEISVFFTFGTHQGEECVMLRKMTYTLPSPEED